MSAPATAIRFTVDGLPTPQARPRRVTLRNGRMIVYSPRSVSGWETAVRVEASKHRPDVLLDGPVGLRITFYLPRPKSAAQRERPHVKPDLDNLEKAVMDALNGIIWSDDRLVCEKHTEKRYGSPARAEVEVWLL